MKRYVAVIVPDDDDVSHQMNDLESTLTKLNKNKCINVVNDSTGKDSDQQYEANEER